VPSHDEVQAEIEGQLVKLRAALPYIDRLSAPRGHTGRERLARDALLRLKSQLRAVLAVATAPGVEGAEIEVQARPILEAAITLGWVGEDEDRARQVEDHAQDQVILSWQEFADAINGKPLSRSVKRPALESLRKRARAAGEFYAGAYGICYPRLSMATHGWAAASQQFQPGLMATANALQDVVTGTTAIVYWIASVFTWDEVKKFAREHIW
jgi:hypothetical protein